MIQFQRLLEGVCESNAWTLSHGEVVISAAGGRTQAIHWKPFQDGNREMVRVWTIIGPAADLTAIRQQAALALNFSLPVGALAIADERLCLTTTFLVAKTDEPELEHCLRSMAATADRYERLIYGGDAH